MNTKTTDVSPELPLFFILVIALFQGIGTYAVFELAEQDYFDVASAPWLSAAIAFLVFAPPLVYLMGRRIWSFLGASSLIILIVLVCSIAAYGGFNTSILSVFDGGSALGIQLWFSVFILVKVSLPFIQTFIDRRGQGSPFHYPSLFQNAWYNTVTVIEGALFTGLVWLILALWMGLFSILNIDVIKDILTEDSVSFTVTAVSFGLGMFLVQRHERYIKAMLSPILGTLAFLLPLAFVVVSSFLVMLPITGVQLIWDTGHASFLLMFAAALLILFCNSAYQDGEITAHYPRFIQVSFRVFVWSIPILVLLAAWGLSLRVEQYGWTVERIQAAAIIGVMLYYGLAYGFVGLFISKRFKGVEKVNVAGAFLVIGVLLLLLSPIFHPGKIAVANQLDRLAQGKVTEEDFDMDFLRFETGKAGYEVLELWASNEPEGSVLHTRAKKMLEKQHRWEEKQPEDMLETMAKLQVFPAGERLSEEQLKALLSWAEAHDERRFLYCLEDSRFSPDCFLIHMNIDDDAEKELVLMPFYEMAREYLQFKDGQWQADGIISRGVSDTGHCEGDQIGENPSLELAQKEFSVLQFKESAFLIFEGETLEGFSQRGCVGTL